MDIIKKLRPIADPVAHQAIEEIERLRAENRKLREEAVFAASVEKERNTLRRELARLREGVRRNAGYLSKEGLVEAADAFYELLNGDDNATR